MTLQEKKIIKDNTPLGSFGPFPAFDPGVLDDLEDLGFWGFGLRVGFLVLTLLIVGRLVGDLATDGEDVGGLEMVSYVATTVSPMTAVMTLPEFFWILSVRLPPNTILLRAASAS